MKSKDLAEICKTDDNKPEEKKLVIEGKLTNIAEIPFVYTDERIFYRATRELKAAYLNIVAKEVERIWLVSINKKKKYGIRFPMIISHGMAQEILNQIIRYTHKQKKYNDSMEGKYTEDIHTLEILSGQRKDQKYEIRIIS